MKKFQIVNDWDNLLWDTIDPTFLERLKYNLKVERYNYIIYPSEENYFKAFELTPFKEVKVILCGPEPYIYPNMADGLAYSSYYAPPRELINIFRKIEDELKIKCDFNNYNLSRWAEQGVLLLNLNLTVRAGIKESHNNLNWNRLTYSAIKLLYNDKRPKVFLLFDNTYQVKNYIMEGKESEHLVLTGPSAMYPVFFYQDYFRESNEFLIKHYGKGINWR